jgi:hypothetical protein
MNKRIVVLAVLSLVLIGLAACITPTSVPEPYPEVAVQEMDLSVELITGTVGYEYSHAVPMAAVVAMDDDAECDVPPTVVDTRPEGHNSLQVLPRLGPDDYEAAQMFFGFNILDHHGCRVAPAGSWYWDIGKIVLECGANNIHPVVHDENGERITDRGILLFLSWVGAPEFPAKVDPPYNIDLFSANIGVGGFTRTGPGGGDLAWAYGPESHIGPDGGPYLVWASSDPPEWGTLLDWSDAMSKLGWWDDHCEFSPYFYLKQKEGGSVPTGTYHLLNIDPDGNIIGIIPFQDGQMPSGVWRLGLRDPEGIDLGYTIWQQED